MSGERETSIGPRRFGIYKRTGRYHAVLYAHTTIEIWRFTFRFSRWHEKRYTTGNPYIEYERPVDRRDYHAEFGYYDGNEEDILNPNVQWAFHTGKER